MQKTHAMAATVLGCVLTAGSALAQTNDQRATAGEGSTTGVVNCPAGCVPAQSAQRQLSPEERRRRAEAVRAMRERREQERLAREQAERDRAAQLAAAQSGLTDAQQRAEAERQARERAERERADAMAQLERERAEHERLERQINEQQRLAAMRQQPRVVARGGGPRYRPRVVLGLEGGVADWGSDVGRATYVGGMWGARVGLDFFSWLGVEGRYFGMYNDTYNPVAGQGIGMTTNGASAVLRLTAPIPFVQPYVFGGLGGYHTTVFRTTSNPAQGSPLRSTSYLAIPVGVGLNVPITNWLHVGAEGTFHGTARESFSADPTLDNAHLWTGAGVVRFRL